MKVLLVRKTTALDLFGEYVRKKVADGLLAASHLEAMQRSHREHQETFAKLREVLDGQGIDHSTVSHGRYWPDVEEFSAVFAVGGDGTVLEASQHVETSTVPILGIRSSRFSIGHLCAYDHSQIAHAVQDLQRGDLKYVHSHRLRAVIHSVNSNSDVETRSILNDFLFCNSNPAATTRYRISLGEESESQMSSGIWFSAPAGSSAAISSAGGIDMGLEDTRFQFKVRELYHPAGVTLKITGQVFSPEQDFLVIETLSDSAVLAPDGHQNSYQLGYGDRITFKRAQPLKLVHRPVTGMP